MAEKCGEPPANEPDAEQHTTSPEDIQRLGAATERLRELTAKLGNIALGSQLTARLSKLHRAQKGIEIARNRYDEALADFADLAQEIIDKNGFVLARPYPGKEIRVYAWGSDGYCDVHKVKRVIKDDDEGFTVKSVDRSNPKNVTLNEKSYWTDGDDVWIKLSNDIYFVDPVATRVEESPTTK